MTSLASRASAAAPSPPASAPDRPRRRRRRTRGAHIGILLALPAVILLALFILWPIVTAVQYSFTSASGFGDQEPAGLSNYGEAFSTPAFWASIGRNIIFAGVVTIAALAVGFVLSYLLFLRVRAWRVLQVLLMVPYILPVVVTGLLWKFLMEPQAGLLNTLLRDLGLGFLAGPWLSAQETALASVSLVQVWVLAPFATLLLFGAMIAIPPEVIEAAEIDGAGHVTRMTRIVLPMVRPTLVLTALVLAVGLFRSFDLVWILTQGGPVKSTTIATLYVFEQGFVNNNYGYANATGVIVGVLLVALTIVPRLLQRRAARRAVAASTSVPVEES